MQKSESSFVGLDLIRKPLLFNGLNPNEFETKYLLNAAKKKSILDEKVFYYIYKHQPELKEKIDSFLLENLDNKNFLELFAQEFNNLFTLKAIAIPLLTCTQSKGIVPGSRKRTYKNIIDTIPDFFLELNDLLLSSHNNNFVNKDDDLFETYFESLKSKKIEEFKISEKQIVQIALGYIGENIAVYNKIFNVFLKKLNKEDYNEDFYISFFKMIRESSEEFNIDFHKKMELEFGENYSKITDFKNNESVDIVEEICIKINLNYKSYIQKYAITQSSATNLVQNSTLAIKRQLIKYTELEKINCEILNTTTSVIFLTKDRILANNIEKYFQLSTDSLNKQLDDLYTKKNSIKVNEISKIIQNIEEQLSTILDFVFLNQNLETKDKISHKKNKI